MKKIITLLIGIFILSSCSYQIGRGEGKNEYEKIVKSFDVKEKNEKTVFTYTPTTIEKNKKAKPNKTVELVLEYNEGKVDITLKNPNEEYLQSVRTWLSFPAKSLEIKNLNLNSAFFDLAAPSEYIVDGDNGLIKIGLSRTNGFKLQEIKIGSFSVKNVTKNSVPLTCYDYNDNSDSHCAVFGEEEKNMLKNFEGIIIN